MNMKILKVVDFLMHLLGVLNVKSIERDAPKALCSEIAICHNARRSLRVFNAISIGVEATKSLSSEIAICHVAGRSLRVFQCLPGLADTGNKQV